MSKILRLLFVVGVIAAFSAGALAQTAGGGLSYTFPGIESPGMELVISNINIIDAVVRVTFFNTDGTTARSLRLTIAAGTQTIVDDTNSSLGLFAGTALVESQTPVSVTATVNRGVELDAVDDAPAASELIIPFVRAGTNANTTLSIFNPNVQTNEVLVMLGTANGTLLNGSRFTLSSKETRFWSLNEASHPVAELNAVTHVVLRSLDSVLTSGRTVSAVAGVRQLTTGAGVVHDDVGLVQGVPIGGLSSTALLPLFVQGFGYFTQMQVVNTSDVSQAITLTARSENGAVIPTGRNPLTVSVPAHGSFSGDVLDVFNLTTEMIGSILITGSNQLTAAALLGGDKSRSLTAIGPAGPVVHRFAFQYRSISRSFFSGLTFYNPSSAEATVSLTFVSNDGSTVSLALLTVPPGNQVTRTLSDVLPEASGSGFIFASSPIPIHASAIEGSSDASVLSQLPSSTVSTGFNPKEQDRFLAVGTARVLGEPVPGATVRLSGPVLGTQITDSVGAFVFRDIPPGAYTVTIQMPGITFATSTASFIITNENRRDINFNGTIVSLTLTSVTPASALTGSRTLQITARGGPFIPSSEIVFDGGVIPTTFVDDRTLTGTISTELLRLSRVASVLVRNRVGGSSAPSQTLTFSIGGPPPVITALEGVPGQIIAGYPGFTVTVNGTGFIEGGTILFNGVPRAYVWDSSTRVRAFIGPDDLAIGRIAPLQAMNPLPTVGPSNSINVTVFNPVAGLTSISPSITALKIEPNSTGLQLVVNGFLFKPGATVQVQGFPALTSTFISATQLVANIPPQALEVGGSFPVTVANPAPNLGSSEVLPLIVENLQPQLTGIELGPLTFSPGLTEETTQAVNFVGVLHGSNFGKQYTVVMKAPSGPWPSCNQPDKQSLSGQVISSTQIVVTIPIKCTGDFFVYVSSPQNQPGGGVSDPVPFAVNAPFGGASPSMSLLSPPSIARGNAFTLSIDGSNFAPGALVNFGTAILTPNASDITPTRILVSVPSFYVQDRGIIPVTVTNPGIGGTSPRLLFSVN